MKEEQNQKQELKEQEEKREEEKTIPVSFWRRLIKNRWFFPALYLIAAALILAFITWYQNPDDYALDADELNDDSQTQQEEQQVTGPTEGNTDSDALPVSRQEEKMIWPVDRSAGIEVVLGYFDDEASEEEQLNAMVEYDRTFHPNQGIDFAHKDGETFDVMAALSGTVASVTKDPLVGNVVELEHDNGLVTVYQGLENVQVKEGDQVKQGEVLGRAGRSIFKQELGIHAHFQVKENGQPVNPYRYLEEASQADEDSNQSEENEKQADEETNRTEEDQSSEESKAN